MTSWQKKKTSFHHKGQTEKPFRVNTFLTAALHPCLHLKEEHVDGGCHAPSALRRHFLTDGLT